MIDVATAPWAALILRVGLGVLFLAHGLLKLLVFKPAGTYGYFKSLGLPGSLSADATMAAELAGGTALIIGFMPRYVALLLIPLILGTIVTVHGKNGSGIHEQRWRLGISGLLGAYVIRPVPARRRCMGAHRFAALVLEWRCRL